jgi:hypothetical protein
VDFVPSIPLADVWLDLGRREVPNRRLDEPVLVGQ